MFQIVPIEAEESNYTASVEEDAGKLNITASAPSDVLPEDAKLIVTPVKNDGNDSLYDDTLNKLNEEAQKENKTIDAFIAYDIQFEKDGKETEPSNGNATVNMKWENPVKPEGVQDSDEISVIHLKNDATIEDLTKEKDETKNHATTETDENDPLSLKAVTLQSNSYSIYTVVWSRDNVSSINVKYTDPDGKEISPAEKVNVTQDAGIDAFAKAIDGYTFSSATINNTNVTELKTENGYLYFNDGINWNQASSTDVCLTYTANSVQETAVPTDTSQPTPEVTTEPTSTPAATEQPQVTATPSSTPETSKKKDTTIEGHTDDNQYNVTVTYGKDAGLPEGTTVSVKTLSEDNDEYENAKNAVAASKNTDADTLGMTALDITLKDKKGNKVEPKDHSKVKVNIHAADLPDNVNSVDIHHIKESSNAFTGFIRNVYTGSSDKAEEVKKNITVTEGKAVTDFEVSSFSVFTITWTTNNSTGTKNNIGNVTMHYVNDSGLEIDRTASLTDGSLSKLDGIVVKISDWVNNNDEGVRKVSGYKYVKATIGTYDGTEITAVKVKSTTENSKTVYKLYYTSVENPSDSTSESDWKEYKDSVSGNNSNNADIYLVFHSTAESVNVHFVDEDGNIIINPIYHYANETYEKYPNGFNIKSADETVNPWYEPIQNYTFTGRVHMGETGWQGFAFSKVRAVQEGENYRYQYVLNDNEGDNENDWTDLTSTDVYLIYKKTLSTPLPSTSVQIHYIDVDGNPMLDEAGNSLDRTVDAADWKQNQWQNLQGYSETVNGYTIQDMAIFVAENGDGAYTNKEGAGSGNSTNGLDETVTKNPSQGVSISGRPFRYLRYTGSVFQAGNGHQIDTTGGTGVAGSKTDKTAADGKINRYWNINGNFQIYLVYSAETTGKTFTYSIHYIDEGGNKIAEPSTVTFKDSDTAHEKVNTFTVGIKSGNDVNAPIGKDITGYTVKDVGLLGRPTIESGGIQFTKMSFTRGTDDIWNYQITGASGTSTGESRRLNLTTLNFYVIYTKNPDTANKAITIHFVDTEGNNIASSGGKSTWETRYTLNRSAGTYVDTNNNNSGSLNSWIGLDFTNTSTFGGSRGFINSFANKGYTFVGEYIGPEFNMDNNKLVTTKAPNSSGSNSCVQWIYQSGKWYVSYNMSSSSADANKKIDGTDNTVFDGYVTDIYWVYSKNINLHYVYVGTDNKLHKIEGQSDKSVTPSTNRSQTTQLATGDNVPAIDGKVHIGTRLGPTWSDSLTGADLGANVVSVYKDNGQLTYSFTNADSPYHLTKQGNNDMWVYAAPSGRRFVLRKTTSGTGDSQKDTYTIEDSQHETVTLNLNAENTYVATFHGEQETTEYTITPDTTSDNTYLLTLREYIPNDLTDVYEMYIDDTNDAKVWINDDLKYSGYFTVGRNQWLEDRMPNSGSSSVSSDQKITDYYYTWQKITSSNADGSDPVTKTVERAQNGIHWNIAYNRQERTWLDIEADNGGRNDTDQKKVAYTVTMHYRLNNGEWQTATSEPLSVDYYSQLMNGDFEDVDKTITGPDGTGNDGTGFYTNSFYKDHSGVWQTTASDNYIEIINTGKDKSTSYDWNSSLAFSAASKNQFAELNANTGGALYQDVITHPNQYLNYWLSHRARGHWPDTNGTTNADKKDIPEYDTMYLVIMPTKLAMTSSSNGGELKSQSELQKFIQNHGGYDTENATAVGQEVTYRDETNGILIEKISSNDQFWHNVNVPNGYVAKGGLTRFFFVAGPTAWNEANPTHGNFIDNVGFAQKLPTPTGFNLTVTKTFTGLTTEQLTSLVNKSETNDNFKITLSDKHINSSSHQEAASDTSTNTALNGAVLSFTPSDDGSAVPFVATAVDANGTNLLIGSSNTGDVRQNDDGITITWTFYNLALDSDKTDQWFDYYATESNDSVDGETLNATRTVSEENTAQPGAALVHQGAEADFTFNNSYRSHGESDQPRITVSKTFYGLTPSAVQEMFADGFEMTVKNNQGETVTLNMNDQTLDSNVSYSESTDDHHNTTVLWTIEGQNWKEGDYTVSENKYSTEDYKISQVKIGSSTTIKSNEVENIPTDFSTITKESVQVGNPVNDVNFDGSTDFVRSDSANGENGSLTKATSNLPSGTNFIAVQYTDGTNTHYLVWTASVIGRNVSEAIINKINNTSNGIGWASESGSTPVSYTDTVFRSGKAGAIQSTAGSIAYDTTSGELTFKPNSNYRFLKFYSTKISNETQADIQVQNWYKPVIRIQKVDSKNPSTLLEGAEFRLYSLGITTDTNSYDPSKGENGPSSGGGNDDDAGAKQNTAWNDEEEERSNFISKLFHNFAMNANAEESGETGSGSSAKKYYPQSGNDWTTSADNAAKFTTGSNGMVSLPANLNAGTYYLEEVTAPSGYQAKTNAPIAFKVRADGSVTLLDSNDAEIDRYNDVTLGWNNPYYLITVPNDPVNIQIQKKSSLNDDQVLGGAEFKIFKKSDDTSSGDGSSETAFQKLYYHRVEFGSVSWTTSEEDANSFITEDGTGIAELPGLYAGTYYLEEVNAPDGFNRLSKPVTFKVTGNGTVEIPKANSDGKYEGVEVANSKTEHDTNSVATLQTATGADNTTTYSIVIKNTPGQELPITGGIGTTIFYIVGGVLVIGAVILLVRRKKKNA